MAKPPAPLIRPPKPGSSPAPSPADQTRMLVELLRVGGPALVRRWVAVLLLAPAQERESIVSAVERRLVELYAEPLCAADPIDAPAESEESDEAPIVHVVSPAAQKEGYVEQVERTYAPSRKARAKPRRSDAGDARSA